MHNFRDKLKEVPNKIGGGNIMDVVVAENYDILINDQFDEGKGTAERTVLKVVARRPENTEYRKGFDWVQMNVSI